MPPRTVPVSFSGASGTARVTAAYTTRHGGVSEPPFASLNCGYTAGDDPDAVTENRRRALAELGLPAADLVVGGQVHGCTAAVVTPDERGRGAEGPADVVPDTDGLLTDVPGLPLAVLTADCVPVFLFAPQPGVVGLLHAGWRGTLRGILDATLAVLGATWRVGAAQVHLAFGPAIGPCCYEIGPDVAEEAAGHTATGDTLRERGAGHWSLDLPGHLCAQGLAAGIPTTHIQPPGPCSKCGVSTYFSYRGEGPRSGRTLSVLALGNSA